MEIRDRCTKISHCKRCGTCCAKGGPALHEADLPLIHDQHLAIHDLITIRPGEPVFSPLSNSIEPSRTELIKVAGLHDSWSCHFFDQVKNLCGIYAHRPLECRLLKCWAPAELTNIIYQHCLDRKDILPAADELRPFIDLQTEQCNFARIKALATEVTTNDDQTILAEIARIVNLDLKIRQRAIQLRQLSVEAELLYFGRPLFKSLVFYQLAFQEGPGGLTVHRTSVTQPPR